MKEFLTKEQRAYLVRTHKREQNGRIRDRIKSVLLCDSGYTYSEIARILLLDDETIRRHVGDYCSKLKIKPESGGSESKLTESETQALITHLHEVTYLYVKDICVYVLSIFGKKYSVSGMTKWLHAHDFGYKKAHAVPAKADKEQQAKFVCYYKKLKKKAGNIEPIYFGDSVHPQHQTQLVYGWMPKGIRKEIATTPYQKRLNFIGGICLNGHRFTYHQATTVNAETICDFLWKLRKNNPGKFIVHLIWDNAKYHRNDQVTEFAKELGIKLHYLPPYSPNLNPVERVWKLMHESVRYNQYYGKFSDFLDATLEFFKSIGRKKCLLRNRITDNFQILHSPLCSI